MKQIACSSFKTMKGFYMRNKGFIGFVLFIIVVILFIGCNVVTHTEHSVIATVCSKEQVSTEKGGHEYRIYSNKETFVIKDSHWPTTWRTNSSEVYGKLHVPGTYEIKYIGIRFGLFSWFHNIMRYKRLPNDKQAISNC